MNDTKERLTREDKLGTLLTFLGMIIGFGSYYVALNDGMGLFSQPTRPISLYYSAGILALCLLLLGQWLMYKSPRRPG